MGAGAAGTLTATRLLDEAGRAHRPVDVTLVDPRDSDGRGVAFSTGDVRHLLNVPAAKMSAYSEDPQHFMAWLSAHGRPVGEADFVPRVWYGDYLSDVLADAARRAPWARLRRVRARAADLTRLGHRCQVVLETGDRLIADTVILAIGHLGVNLGWAPEELRTSPALIADPWQPDALTAVPADGDVLLVGTGLTMVDAYLVVQRPGRVVHAVSRHGELPRSHRTALLPAMEAPEFSVATPSLAELREVMRSHMAKAKARYGDWRPAVDSIRPITQRLWAGLDDADRAEFAALDARAWDALRHRVPPASASVIADARQAGVLRTHRGRVLSAHPNGVGLAVTLSTGETVSVGAVVNCTGPCDRPADSPDPFIGRLLERGLARPGALGIGFEAAGDGRVLPRSGSSLSIWTLGALRKGALWESTAIPEIRDQAAALARCLFRESRTAARPVDPYGLPLSTTAAAAAAWCRAINAVRRVQAHAVEALAEAIEADPDFALGHAAMALLGHEWDLPVDRTDCLRRSVEAVRFRGDARERSFVHMVRSRLTGPVASGDRELRRHIAAHPRDCLAVSIALPTIAFSGLSQPVEAAWQLVDELTPAYGDDWWFLGIRAFSRQEQERWAEAESLASRALDGDPAAGHAAHARTHVCYETGAHESGLQWLDGWIAAHGSAANFRAHYSWHAALHELALDDLAAARDRFATQLSPAAVTGARALIDSVSLLWRLRLLDAWPGDLPVAPLLETVDECVFDRPTTPFAALHAIVGMAAAADIAGLERLRHYLDRQPQPVFRDVLATLCAGFAAVAAARPRDGIRPLTDVLPHLRQLGGSVAQQEVVVETLLYALTAAGEARLARELLAERLRRRESPLDRRRLATLS
ncbi:MAG TPA: FAD/NAD(P)-binding protein [Mycobacteriales bacterium]|nr:FAD/NAD(P)-binding protein [Mycobacteriales bacterium]